MAIANPALNEIGVRQGDGRHPTRLGLAGRPVGPGHRRGSGRPRRSGHRHPRPRPESPPPFVTTNDKVMTAGGTFTATLVLFMLLLAGGWVGWQNVSQTVTKTIDPATRQQVQTYALHFPSWILPVMLGALGLAFLTIFKPKLARITAPFYAVGEGLVLGAISAAFNLQYKGIVLQAVLATMSVFAVMLFLYATRLIKVTERFRRIVIFSMLGILVLYGVSFVVSLFGGSVPFLDQPVAARHRPLGGHRGRGLDEPDAQLRLHRAGHRGPGPALHGVVRRVRPHGLGLVWLYLEILRLLAAAAPPLAGPSASADRPRATREALSTTFGVLNPATCGYLHVMAVVDIARASRYRRLRVRVGSHIHIHIHQLEGAAGSAHRVAART